MCNIAPHQEDVRGIGGNAQILTSATDGVVSFTLWSLYSWGKGPRYPLNRRLWGREKYVSPAGNRTLAELFWFCLTKSIFIYKTIFLPKLNVLITTSNDVV
jgi:hypothetical protein